MDSPCDEHEFRNLDTGRFTIVIVLRGIRRRMVVAIPIRIGIHVRMHIPPEVPIRVVAVMDVIVVSHGPSDGDGRSRRLTDTVVQLKAQFAGTHWVVERPVREWLQTLEFGAKIVKRTGIDGTSQRV